MKNYLKTVEEFHQFFEHPVLDAPKIPSKDRSDLRYNLLSEELTELKVAIEENNLVAVADAFADLQYVLSGAILEFGMKNHFDELFNEVHRSNMSKSCASLDEAHQTMEKYREETGMECYTEGRYIGDVRRWFVYRASDDKTIKSINYSPANLAAILNRRIVVEPDFSINPRTLIMGSND